MSDSDEDVWTYVFAIHLPLHNGLREPSCCVAFKHGRLFLKNKLVPRDFHAALFCNQKNIHKLELILILVFFFF